MDAINTQTRDNLGSIIPTSQNVPLKEDLEFLPKTTTKSSVKLLRRLAILAAIVSTFGLVSNEIAFYHFSSFYNFTCTFTSLASLIISSALIFWSTKTLNHEEGNTDAVPTRRWELFNQALYTTLLFRTAISIPLITNMLFYGDNTSHHLRAIEATYQDGTVSSTENALRSIAPVLPFFEVLLSLTFVQAARTVFPYIREQTSTMTRMVFIGSAVLMASSFGMLYALRYASDYQDLYGQPFPSWNIGGLVFLGIVSSIVAGLVWTVNHTKWRAPYTIVAGVLAASTLGLALFSTLSYNNSQNIASLYGDMNNLHTWSEQMAATNKEELRTIGCPTKYLPKSIANDPSFDAFWGPGATTKDGLPTKYLNIACVELLGSQQASYFAEATTYGLLTAASGLIILIGFLYFNHTQWRDVGERNKKDFRWLLVLGAIALTFNVAMIMYDAPLPSENAKLALNSISNSNVYFVDDAAAADATAADATAADATAADATATDATATDATTTTADAAPAASGDSTTANTQVDVGDRYTAAFNDLTSKRFRFMVFKHDSIIPGQVNIEAGPWNWEFLDFANTFAPNEQQVGFIMLGDEGKEKPFMVIFAPQDTATKDVLDGFGLPYNTQDFQRAGLPDASNYVARTKKDLDFNSILGQSNSGIVAIFADDAPADASAADATTADATATDATATDATATDATTTTADAAPADSAAAAPDASGDSTATSSTQVSDRYKAAFNDLTSKRFRFMIFKRDPTIPLRVNIEAGPWEWEFIDFTNALNAAEQQVGFVMIGENGKERPYMVVYAPGGAPVKDVLDLFSLPYNTGDLVNAGLSGLTYFVANTKKQLDEATVVGQSQAGTLVLSDNTMILATANSINSVYNQTIQDLVSRKSRFVVFKHDTKDPWRINLVIGNQNAIFSDFNLAFDEGREQVGIMYVGQGSSVQPYLVVLAPGYKTASQVLDGFELPTNSSEYEKLGLKRLNYYVAKERKEITLTTVVMKGQAGGRISLYQFEEGQWEAPELEDNGGEYDDEPAIFAESDPNPYGIILKALDNKKYRFAILKSDPNNPMNVKVAAAPWKWGFNDFVANIDPAQEQIGFITLGPKGAEKPYMIVYAPSATTTARSVLNRFSVPTSTEDLQKAGLSGASYYVARKIEDLDLNAIATQSQAGSVGILLAYEEESDEPEDEQDQGAFEGQDDQQEQSDQEQSDHDGSSGDSNEDGSTEITAIDDAAAEDSTGSEDVPVFQAVTNNPYAGLFNGLNDKKYRFIVLKHDPNDPMAVKISGGPWKMTFQDFLNSIDQNREQVAFVYIGPTYSEKLYRVVVAPSVLNSNAAYVVDGFQLPRDSKGLAQLGLKGVPTYVAGSKSDLTEQKIITYGKASV